MKRICAKILSLMLLLTSPALASSWEECIADVTVNHKTQGGYNITIEKAEVTNGMEPVGTDCLKDKWNVPLNITTEDNLMPGEEIRLKYTRYGGMGITKPVSVESWRETQVK